MQTIRPAKDGVFAEPLEKITQTESGLALTEDSALKPQMAKVLGVGKAVDDIKPGEVIVYKPYAMTEIKLNGRDYLLIRHEDIEGVIKG